MVSLINKQLLLTAYAYLFIMEQPKAQQGSEALQLQADTTQQAAMRSEALEFKEYLIRKMSATPEMRALIQPLKEEDAKGNFFTISSVVYSKTLVGAAMGTQGEFDEEQMKMLTTLRDWRSEFEGEQKKKRANQNQQNDKEQNKVLILCASPESLAKTTLSWKQEHVRRLLDDPSTEVHFVGPGMTPGMTKNTNWTLHSETLEQFAQDHENSLKNSFDYIIDEACPGHAFLDYKAMFKGAVIPYGDFHVWKEDLDKFNSKVDKDFKMRVVKRSWSTWKAADYVESLEVLGVEKDVVFGKWNKQLETMLNSTGGFLRYMWKGHPRCPVTKFSDLTFNL